MSLSVFFFFFSSRRRHTRSDRDWSSDVCSSDLATNGIHHHSGKDDMKGVGQAMDLFDIFSGQESWHTRRLLELAKTLNDEQLDSPLKNQIKVFPWDSPDQSLRQILDRIVQTKEVWAAALTGGSMPAMDNAPS